MTIYFSVFPNYFRGHRGKVSRANYKGEVAHGGKNLDSLMLLEQITANYRFRNRFLDPSSIIIIWAAQCLQTCSCWPNGLVSISRRLSFHCYVCECQWFLSPCIPLSPAGLAYHDWLLCDFLWGFEWNSKPNMYSVEYVINQYRMSVIDMSECNRDLNWIQKKFVLNVKEIRFEWSKNFYWML